MKKLITIWLAILILVPSVVFSQSKSDINRAVWKVITEGILYPDAFKSAVFFDDFYNLPDTTNNWDVYMTTTTGKIEISTVGAYRFSSPLKYGGGILTLANNGGTQSTVVNIQKKGIVAVIETDTSKRETSDIQKSDRQIEFEAKVFLNDTTNIGFVAGLITADDDSVRNGSAFGGIYFEKPYGTNTYYFRSRRAGTTVSRTLTKITANSDTSWITLKFVVYDTNNVIPYVNGLQDSAITTYIPFDSVLVPTFEVSNDTVSIDYVKVVQKDR